MAKEILGVDGQIICDVPSIKDVQPCGSQVLVELLTAQEALGTILSIESSAINGAPQGYVRKTGPRVAQEWGFKVGDRVTLHGNYTPLPEGNFDRPNSHRPWILVEPQQIKAILVEKK